MADPTETLAIAIAQHQAGRLEEAEQLYRQVLAVEPNEARAWHFLGVIAHQRGNHDNAIFHIGRSLALQPDNAEAHNNLATVLEFVGRFDEAIACCQRALELRPDYAAAHHNLGYVLTSQGAFAAAAACYRRALAHRPDFAKAHYHLSTLLLLAGDFEQGWPGYEWRWQAGNLPLREFAQPKWMGQTLHGKTMFLHTEQGFGDNFQFIRYAPLVKERGATVIVECSKPLLPLLPTCPGIDRLMDAGDELPPFDFHSPLLSLPGASQTRLETIPANVPYLFADPTLSDEWRAKLAVVSGFRVGINWQGRTGQGYFRRRDFPLECLIPIAQIPGVRLINLHKGEGRQELAELARRLSVVDPGADLDTTHGAFMDTAAIMRNLDLVITSDTSIAHLAGALGVSVWVALPFVPDWRWLLDRSDSPWYPTMRLFRQKSPGDWSSVFAEMESALHSRLSQARSTIPPEFQKKSPRA